MIKHNPPPGIDEILARWKRLLIESPGDRWDRLQALTWDVETVLMNGCTCPHCGENLINEDEQ